MAPALIDDPMACLGRLLDAIADDEPDLAADCLRDFSHWRERGGCTGKGWPGILHEAAARVRLLRARGRPRA